MRMLLQVFAVVGASMSVVSVANGATVTVRGSDDGILYYSAAPGEKNEVILDPVDDERVRITDVGAVITASGRCRSIDAHSAECRGAGKDPIFYETKLK